MPKTKKEKTKKTTEAPQTQRSYSVKAPVEIELIVNAETEDEAYEQAVKYLEHLQVVVQRPMALLYKPHITKLEK